MIKSITNFLIICFIFQQLKSQISQIDQNGVNLFCDETLQIHVYLRIKDKIVYTELVALAISFVYMIFQDLHSSFVSLRHRD